MKHLHLVLAHDEKKESDVLRQQLEQLGHSVVAQVQDGPEAVRLVEETHPDALLLSYSLLKDAGLDLQALPPVIVLSAHDDCSTAESAYEMGAAGLLPLPPSDSALAWALAVAGGRAPRDAALLSRPTFCAHAVNTVQALILGLDRQGDIIFFNDRCEEVTGWRREEVLGKNWFTHFLPERVQPPVRPIFKELLGSTDHNQYENAILTRSGEERIIAWHNAAIRDATGETSLVLATGLDVTERRQAEDLLYPLNAVALAVQQTREPQEIFEILGRKLNALGFECSVLLSDERSDHFKVAFTSYAPEIVAAAEKMLGRGMINYRIPIETVEMLKTASRERRATLTFDAESAVRQALPESLGAVARQMAQLLKTSRLIAAPLVAGDRLLGVLIISAPTLAEPHVPAVTAFANQLAVALENAHLFASETQRRQETEILRQISAALTSTLDPDQLLDLILEQLERVVAFDSAAVMLVDGPDLTVAAGRGFADMTRILSLTFRIAENPLFREIQTTRAPLVLQDAQADGRFLGKGGTEYIRAWMGIPLLIKNQVIGCLTVDSFQPGVYTLQEARLVQSFADQAAIAIQNARLYQESQRKTQELASIYETALALGSVLDIDALLARLYDQVRQLLAPDSFGVFLYDAENQALEVMLAIEKGEQVEQAKGMRLPLSEGGLTGWVLDERQPLLVEDLLNASLPVSPRHVTQRPTRAWLGVPLVTRERLIGAISVQSFQPSAFDEADRRFLETLAAPVAIALENARLFAAECDQAQRQAALFRISADLTATLDEQEVCRRVVQGLHDTLGYRYLALFLIDERTDERVLTAKIGWPDFSLGWRLSEGQGLSERPSLDGQLHYTPDVTGEPGYIQGLGGSEVDVPLRFGDEVLGVLVVESQRKHAFGRQDFDVLTAVANQIAVAIDKARLLKSERRRADQLEALRATMVDISTERELSSLLQAVLKRAVHLLHATGGELGLFDGQKEIEIVASHNMGRDYTGTRHALGEGAMGYAAESRQPVTIQDYAKWSGRSPRYANGPWHGVLAVPLLTGQRLVGAIGIVDANPQRQFSPADVRLLDLFAQQAASAVENARLLQETQAVLAKTQALYRVSRSLTALDSLADLLQAVVDNVAQALPADRVVLITFNEEERRLTNFAKGGPGAEQVHPVSFDELWNGLSGWVLRESKPALSLHGQPDPRESEAAQRRRVETNCGAIIVVPLRHRDEMLGTMTAINTPEQPDFDEQDVELMVTMANQAAIALENTHLFLSTHQQAEQLEALHQVSRDLMALQELDTLLKQIIERAVQLIGGEAGGIYLHKPEQDLLEWVVAVGEGVELLGTTLERGQGLSGQIWESGEPLIVENYQEWSGQAAQWADLNGSVLGVPVQWGDEFLGVLNIRAAVDHGTFSSKDAQLLSRFATQAAIAIDNVRLHEAQRQQADELARLHRASDMLFFSTAPDIPTLAQNIVQAVLREFGQANCSLLLLDPADGGLERVGVAGPYQEQVARGKLSLDGPGLVPRAMRSGQIVNVPDVLAAPDYVANWKEARSELAVPLRVGERVIGALDVQSSRPSAFSPVDERLLTAFAERAALALENARLYRETVHRADEMASLYEIGLATVSSLSLDKVLSAIYEQCQAVLPSETFYVALHRPNERQVTFPMFIDRGTLKEVEPLDFEQESFTTHIIRERRPLVLDVPRGLEKQDPVQPMIQVDNPPTTYLGVPLILRDQVIGVLSVQSSSPNAYTDDHVRLITTIANQAAIAIENARLYQESERRQVEARALYRATLPVPTLDLPSVLATLAERATALTNLPQCIIYLLEPQETIVRAGAARGFPQEQTRTILDREIRPREQSSAWQKVYVERRPYVATDVQLDLYEPQETADQPPAALLIVPLVAGERLLGSLHLRGEPRSIPERLVRQVETFAAQAATAIENARLYSAVQEYARSLQMTSWEKEQLLEQVQHYAETLEQEVEARTAQIFAEKEKVEAILASAGDAIVITDAENRIGYVNDAFTSLTGHSAQEISDQDVQRLFSMERVPPTRIATLFQALAQGDLWRGDLYLKRKDGHVIQCDVNIAPVRDENGHVISYVGVLRDVTQARALERAKAEFLTNVSHQLRTPVTNLKTYTFLLGKGTPEKQEQYVQVMEQEVEKLSHLVQDLLEIAELDAGPIVTDWAPVRMSEIVASVVTRFQAQAERAGLALKADLPPATSPTVLGNKSRLAQALNQIVENAVFFTAEGEIQIKLRFEASEAIVSVTDTGPGIPPEEQIQLFDRFFRGQAAQPGHILGTGLGLSMAKMIVQAHGGEITVRSQVGQGSTFEVRLPLAKQKVPALIA